jgi:hypothetical protein
MSKWMLLPLLLLLPAAHAQDEFPNLVQNPGFESVDANGRADDWNAPSEVFVVDDTVAHSGQRSMRIVNTDPAVYLLCSQALPARPGEFYDFSVWVKAQDVRGEEGGATICMEWAGKDGYIGGSYPSGIVGTADWTLVQARSAPIPANATRASVTVYLRKGMTGTAWFDDVVVRRAFPPPLLVNLLDPNYRGLIFPNVPTPRIRLEAHIGQPLRGGLGLGDVELHAGLVRGRVAAAEEAEVAPLASKTVRPSGKRVIVELDAATLAPGRYTLRVSLVTARGGRALAEERFAIEKLSPESRLPTVYIDDHNRTIVNGQPFFPLGMYFGDSPTSPDALPDLQTFSGSSFNTLMDYAINDGSLEEIERYLDEANRLGLKVIYSIKDLYSGTRWYPKQIGPWTTVPEMVTGIVDRFKGHPALLAWYLNDELPVSFLPQLTERYETVRKLDPDHPTWIVLYQVGELEQYLPTFDVLGTDPYPIPSAPIRRAADWTIRTVEAVNDRRAVWMVPQAHNWSVYNRNEKPVRGPTYEEMRAMAFLCIVHGAKGLVFYSFFDLKRDPLGFDKRWADMRKVADDVADMAPVVLSTERPPRLRVTAGKEVIHSAIYEYEGTPYVIAVNPSSEPQPFSFAVRTMRSVALEHNGTHVVPWRKGEYRDTLAPLAVRIYEIRSGGGWDAFPQPIPLSPRGKPGQPPWT